jgi:hypothetical protein
MRLTLGCDALMSEPSGWMRLPRATSAESSARQQRQLVGRGGHVGVGEDHEIVVDGQHAGPHRRALAAVILAQQPQRRAAHAKRLVRAAELGAGAHQPGGAVDAAVVHHQHFDASGQLAPGNIGAQVGEQFVQSRPQPGLLVVCGQNDSETAGHLRECIGVPAPSHRRMTPGSPGRRPPIGRSYPVET